MKKHYNLKTQEQAIKYFMEQMDVEMLGAFLDDNFTYQNMAKEKFLAKLVKVFDSFQKTGDTSLYSYNGNCGACYKDKIGWTFVGNHSLNYISIIFDSKNGTITDLFECSRFVNKQMLILNRNLYIDNVIFKL